jgi:Carboxypeptidase regulatory-like domain
MGTTTKLIRILLMGLALIFLAIGSVPAHGATVFGTVLDSQGAVIPKAYVVVRWDSVGLDGVKDNVGTNENKTTTTDETGHFSLELPLGVYDIFVSSAGFSPRCSKITLKTQDGLRYEVRLSVSRMLKIKFH